MSPRWNNLPTQNISAPSLLYSFTHTPQSYDFILTDLTHIWHENLQKKSILQKAEDIGTSIDPSEDANQYDVFMRKIQDALEEAKNTSVIVTSGEKSDSIIVKTRITLPGGLQPLKWTFTLSKAPPSAVTRQLILPLLRSERNHKEREQSLIENIREKDNVLSKIFDQIDPSLLTSIFPGTAGARHTKLKTSDLIRHIKGATRFDEKAWQGSPSDDENLASGLGDSVYAQGGLTSPDSTRIADTAWWKSLDDVEDTVLTSPERSTAMSKMGTGSQGRKFHEEQVAADEDMSTEDDDDFQRQETPPHLKRRKEQEGRKPIKNNESDMATDLDEDAKSDDGLDSTETPVQKAPKKVMGRIGGPKAVPLGRSQKESTADETDSDDEPNQLTPDQRTPVTHNEPELDDGTASDSEPKRSPPRPDLSKTKKEVPSKIVPKKKGVLGKIGGKKPEPKQVSPPELPITKELKESTTDDEEGDLEQRHVPSKPRATPTKGKKLGLIGGGKKKSQAVISQPIQEETDEDLDVGSREAGRRRQQKGPSTSPPQPPAISRSPSPIPHCAPKTKPEPELSAEQKANQKREELKRQLDAKSKAPTKKKRKF